MPCYTNQIHRYIDHTIKNLPTEKIGITTTQVQLSISNSMNNNSTGPDGINIRNLKYLGSLVVRDLTNIYTALPSTLTQYPIFGNVPESSLFQNQIKTTTLARTFNPYHLDYHI